MDDNPILFDEEVSVDIHEEKKIQSATLLDEIQETHEVFSTGATGVRQFRWDLYGMDCPDCASTAEKALTRISGLESCDVSATSGSVEMTLDLERVNAAQANAMLVSLGYTAKADWYLAENIDFDSEVGST